MLYNLLILCILWVYYLKMSQAILKVISEPEKPPPELSLFLPVLNEEDNLRPMHAKISEALNSLGKTAEVIYVDDGSTDNSLKVLREISAKDSPLAELWWN